MRLYSIQKRHLAIIHLIFLLFIGIFLFIGSIGPTITNTIEVKASQLLINDIKHGPFMLKTQLLNRFHQQLWVYCEILIDNNRKSEEFSKKIEINLKIFNENSKFNDTKHEFNRSRVVHCTNEVCM
jgi:hypothetical protein